MLKYQLSCNRMDVLVMLATDAGDAERQLTLLGISMTFQQGKWGIITIADLIILSVYGVFPFTNTYELRLIKD